MSDQVPTEKSEEKIFPTVGETVEHLDAYMPQSIQSLCVNCEEMGQTRLLLTKVPHFKELIVMSFSCDHCGYRNQEVQFGGSYSEKGIKLELSVHDEKDLNRQIVKSDAATLRIPEIDFEIPANTQKGTLNTLEGILMRAIEGLEEQQPVRRIMNATVAAQIDAFIQKLRDCVECKHPFTVILDDPSGNSNIEKLTPTDPQVKMSQYTRTVEQNRALGLGLQAEYNEQNQAEHQENHDDKHVHMGSSILSSKQETERFQKKFISAEPKEIFHFPEKCSACGVPGTLNMVVTDIPHFKEIILMAFTCENCGFRTSEVKAGGAIAPKGTRIKLRVEAPEDMNRDLLKSETASIQIPEIELDITEGSMGGRFTTIEGLLSTLREQLANMNQFTMGDSSLNITKMNFAAFLDRLAVLETGNEPFTLILDDPVSNSYIQNLYAPDIDPQLEIEEYTRTWEQDEELGLHQMNVDNYHDPNIQHSTDIMPPLEDKPDEKH
jgi:zinc finger protein